MNQQKPALKTISVYSLKCSNSRQVPLNFSIGGEGDEARTFDRTSRFL